jgi:hypothetical protein
MLLLVSLALLLLEGPLRCLPPCHPLLLQRRLAPRHSPVDPPSAAVARLLCWLVLLLLLLLAPPCCYCCQR